jgi:hypothetical protein
MGGGEFMLALWMVGIATTAALALAADWGSDDW